MFDWRRSRRPPYRDGQSWGQPDHFRGRSRNGPPQIGGRRRQRQGASGLRMEKASAKRGRAPCGAGFVRSGRPFSSLPAAGLLLACAVGLLAVAGTVPAAADPVYEGPVLYGLDPVIRATDDPRLLGVERLVLLRRVQGFGVDPYLGEPDRRPDLESSFRQYWRRAAPGRSRPHRDRGRVQRPARPDDRDRIPQVFLSVPVPGDLAGRLRLLPAAAGRTIRWSSSSWTSSRRGPAAACRRTGLPAIAELDVSRPGRRAGPATV